MERFPRGTLSPNAFAAIATVAPQAVVRPVEPEAATEPAEPNDHAEHDLTTTCPTCLVAMQPEHAHYKCLRCGYRDSCCF